MAIHNRGLWTISLTAMIAVASAHEALTLETVVADGACRIEGFARPLRQTVVIVDQAVVEAKAGNDIGDGNRRWLNKVLTIAGVQDGQSSTVSASRERISVLLAARDGSDLVRVFTGCVPTFSPEEIAAIKKSNAGIRGQLDHFLGRDIDNKIESGKKNFRSKLTAALAELLSNATKSSAAPETFYKAFSILPSSVDLSEGSPRLIIISAMNIPELKSVGDGKAARLLGFEMAGRVGGDLQRSDVYLTGVGPNFSRFGRDFAQTFFLGMKGRLVATSTEALPAMLEPPLSARVFGGFIDYGGVKVPMQMRVAIDRTGSLIESWMEVSVRKPIATPLSGKAVCRPDDANACEVKGDGKGFAQSWSAEVGADPKFDETLPFSGVRYFEFTTDKNSLKGRAFDPLVVINGKKDLPFELTLTPNVKF